MGGTEASTCEILVLGVRIGGLVFHHLGDVVQMATSASAGGGSWEGLARPRRVVEPGGSSVVVKSFSSTLVVDSGGPPAFCGAWRSPPRRDGHVGLGVAPLRAPPAGVSTFR